MPHGHVLQVHYVNESTLDVRSGQVSRERPSLSLLFTWLLSAFELPEVQP